MMGDFVENHCWYGIGGRSRGQPLNSLLQTTVETITLVTGPCDIILHLYHTVKTMLVLVGRYWDNR